jgi:hypothetical protein
MFLQHHNQHASTSRNRSIAPHKRVTRSLSRGKQAAERTRSQRPHELEIIDAQGPRAAPQFLVPRVLLHFFRRQRVVLVGKVRHELLLLLGDGFPLCRAHAPSRGSMMEMGIVQNALLGLVEHMRQRAMHRGGGVTWTW